jgi:peptide/nickel transport system substrate-binding protein
MKLTFQLRRGVTFSDGEPLTVEDVIYSYQLSMNPKINAPRLRAYLGKIKSVDKTGEDEVTFTMAEPYFEALDLCGSMDILPKHFYSKFDPEEINQNPGLIMGTGPYKLRDPAGWRPGQKIELVRNESYWGPPGTFSRMIFLEVEEEAAQETMFGNGEIDVYRALPEQFDRALKNSRISGHANSFVIDSTINGYYFIAWNQLRGGQKTLFSDARVRKAMTLLANRQQICRDVFLGYATPISGPASAGSPQLDPSILPLPYDVQAGKALLADAGFLDRNGDGVLESADGKPFRFKLSYGSGNATVDRYMLFLKDGYAKAGITVDLDPADWPILLKKEDQRDYDAIHMGWAGALESDLYQEFDSSQIADAGDNFMSYANPELDKVVREARRTVDRAKRMELWHQAHRILAEDQPYAFLFSRKVLRLIDKRVQNVRPTKTELNLVDRWRMPVPWYVPKPMQKYIN